ncbi:MAG: hypothetical protein IAI50_16415 [Candidatus Eremiobacteraeota bacterium]|nr:hypothetical protein [Candidatus Eremiobacteraeota bacterium]
MSDAALDPTGPALPTLPAPEPLTAQNATPAPAPAMQPNAAPPVISKEPVELYSGGDHPTGTTNAALSDMALAGGPVARRDGALVELTR